MNLPSISKLLKMKKVIKVRRKRKKNYDFKKNLSQMDEFPIVQVQATVAATSNMLKTYRKQSWIFSRQFK